VLKMNTRSDLRDKCRKRNSCISVVKQRISLRKQSGAMFLASLFVFYLSGSCHASERSLPNRDADVVSVLCTSKTGHEDTTCGVGIALNHKEIMTSSQVVASGVDLGVRDPSGHRHSVIGVRRQPDTYNGTVILVLSDSVQGATFPRIATHVIDLNQPLGFVGLMTPPLCVKRSNRHEFESRASRRHGCLVIDSLFACQGSPVYDTSGEVVGIVSVFAWGNKKVAWVDTILNTRWTGVYTIQEWESSRRDFYTHQTADQKFRQAGVMRKITLHKAFYDREREVVREDFDMSGKVTRTIETRVPLCPTDTTLYSYDSVGRVLASMTFNNLNGVIQQASWQWIGDSLSIVREMSNGGEEKEYNEFDEHGYCYRSTTTNNSGLVVSQIERHRATDSLGRLTMATEMEKDRSGNITSRTITYFDEFGRPVKELGKAGTTTFTYDAVSNLTEEISHARHGNISLGIYRTTYSYDGWGLVVSKSDASISNPQDSYSEEYRYDYYP